MNALFILCASRRGILFTVRFCSFLFSSTFIRCSIVSSSGSILVAQTSLSPLVAADIFGKLIRVIGPFMLVSAFSIVSDCLVLSEDSDVVDVPVVAEVDD